MSGSILEELVILKKRCLFIFCLFLWTFDVPFVNCLILGSYLLLLEIHKVSTPLVWSVKITRGLKTYEHNRLDEMSIVDRHRCHKAAKFGVFVDEVHNKLPKLYWLPKLHERPYKSRFIANSSSCTTTELSILLASCLIAVKIHVIKYCTTVNERNGKKLFWSI